MRVEVPRVVGRAVRRVLGGRAHRELVHVGLAEHHQCRRRAAAPRSSRRTAAASPRGSSSRPVVGTPRVAMHVLDRDRHAGQRAERARRPARAASTARAAASAPSASTCRNACTRLVDRGDPVEVGPGHLIGGGLAARRSAAAELARAVILVRSLTAQASSSRIRGTRKRPSSASGAPDSASSRVRPASRRRRAARWSAARSARWAGCRRPRPRRPGRRPAGSRRAGRRTCRAPRSVTASRDRRARCATSSREMAAIGAPSRRVRDSYAAQRGTRRVTRASLFVRR